MQTPEDTPPTGPATAEELSRKNKRGCCFRGWTFVQSYFRNPLETSYIDFGDFGV